MINQTGSAPQFTPSVIQNNPQQDPVKQQVQQQASQDNSVAQKTPVQNLQAIAQNIIAEHTQSSTESVKPSLERGQVVDVLV